MAATDHNSSVGISRFSPSPAGTQISSEREAPARFSERCPRTVKLGLVVLGIAVGLTLAEFGMRSFRLGSTRTVSLYHDELIKFPPHMSFMNYSENTNLVVMNNLGFHDRERQATNENYRILVLGDSFVEGRQVKTEDLFTSLLEQRLTSEGQKIEIINAGVLGTGTPYQYVLWKDFFENAIKVDHVVVCLYLGNDLVDNSPELVALTSGSSHSGIFVDSQGNVISTVAKPGLFKRAINLGRDHSVLVNSLYEGCYRLKAHFQSVRAENGSGPAEAVGAQNSGAAWSASEQGTLALLHKWSAELAGKKTPFDLVMIDRPGRVYNKFELEFIDKLAAACARDQIGFLRLQLAGDPFKFYSFDGIVLGHFNNQGHEAVANELYQYFETHYRALPAVASPPAN
jgi:lysophospholipase L1-like esterase